MPKYEIKKRHKNNFKNFRTIRELSVVSQESLLLLYTVLSGSSTKICQNY